MRMLVIGASGYLGGGIRSESGAMGTFLSRPVAGCVRYDFFREPLEPLLDRLPPADVVVFAAAVERQEALATQFLPAVSRFTRTIAARNLRLIYISSDAVFSGNRGSYCESDHPDATTLYGRHLSFFEGVVREQVPRHLIVRVGYLYGDTDSHPDRRMQEARDALQRTGQFLRYDNVYRSPLEVKVAARAIARLATSTVTGVIHLHGARTSLFEFYRSRFATLGMDPQQVVPNTAEPAAVDGLDTSLVSKRCE